MIDAYIIQCQAEAQEGKKKSNVCSRCIIVSLILFLRFVEAANTLLKFCGVFFYLNTVTFLVAQFNI